MKKLLLGMLMLPNFLQATWIERVTIFGPYTVELQSDVGWAKNETKVEGGSWVKNKMNPIVLTGGTEKNPAVILTRHMPIGWEISDESITLRVKDSAGKIVFSGEIQEATNWETMTEEEKNVYKQKCMEKTESSHLAAPNVENAATKVALLAACSSVKSSLKSKVYILVKNPETGAVGKESVLPFESKNAQFEIVVNSQGIARLEKWQGNTVKVKP